MTSSNQTGSHKYAFALVVLGILIAVGLYFVTKNSWTDYLTVNDQRNQLEAKVNATNALISQRQIYELSLEELKGYFPSSETNIADLALALENNAASTGVNLVINFDDFPQNIITPNGNKFGLSFSATVDGPYQAVTAWLKQVEALPYFMLINSSKVNLSTEFTGVKASFEGIIIMREDIE